MPLIKSHAKVNLGLEILGRRADGFHEIRTVMARVALHDQVTFRPSAEIGVRWPAGQLAPADDLIKRAALLLREHTASSLGARIALQKSIPIAAGLGGGSSNAAATLSALNEMWRTGLSPAELATLGAQLGSDVPFFFNTSPSLVGGRGDELTPIAASLDSWIVLIAPGWETRAKTGTLYAALNAEDFSDGAEVEGIAASIRRGESSSIELGNTFERVIDRVFPRWSETRRELERDAGARFWLTGAGPSLYALADSEIAAITIADHVSKLGHPAIVTQFVDGALRLQDESC